MSLATLAAIFGLALATGSCAQAAPSVKELTATQEVNMSDQPPALPSADRRAPRRVPPVERAGVRYEQNLNATEAEFGQVGGVLNARDVNTGALLWSLKVYPNARQAGLEGDVQDVFFRSMAFDDQGHLVIENERGARFLIDVATRSVIPAP
jgi:hypothetical protein